MDQDDEQGDESLDLSSSPHDAFFKSVFSEPEYAVGFLSRRLPPAISAAADWGSLQVLPGSFVKSSLSQVHSDLVFSLQIGSTSRHSWPFHRACPAGSEGGATCGGVPVPGGPTA